MYARTHARTPTLGIGQGLGPCRQGQGPVLRDAAPIGAALKLKLGLKLAIGGRRVGLRLVGLLPQQRVGPGRGLVGRGRGGCASQPLHAQIQMWQGPRVWLKRLPVSGAASRRASSASSLPKAATCTPDWAGPTHHLAHPAMHAERRQAECAEHQRAHIHRHSPEARESRRWGAAAAPK
jgi:hypothetical protein